MPLHLVAASCGKTDALETVLDLRLYMEFYSYFLHLLCGLDKICCGSFPHNLTG